jgi:pyruvate kinase
MKLPSNKPKIVCTIGPASQSRDMMEKLLLAGMNIARLNFSHGDFSGHKEVIANFAPRPEPPDSVLPSCTR